MAKRKVTAFLLAAALSLSASAAPQLGKLPAEEWIEALEGKERVQGLKMPEVLEKLSLKPGMVVADIGAGSGIFSFPISRSVKPGGRVLAVEVDVKLIEHILMAATEQGIVNIDGVFGEFDDPALPEKVDFAFVNETLHHVEHRDLYLKNLAGHLKPSGRVAIIEFKPGQGSHANNSALQVSQEQSTAWMAAAGLKPVQVVSDVFADRWFVIYGR